MKIFIAFCLGIVGLLMTAGFLTIVWAWHVSPALQIPAISYPNSVGLLSILLLFSKGQDREIDTILENVVTALTNSIFIGIMVLVISGIAYLFT